MTKLTKMIFFKFTSIILVITTLMANTSIDSNAAITDYVYVPTLFNPFAWFSRGTTNSSTTTIANLSATIKVPTSTTLGTYSTSILHAPTRTTTSLPNIETTKQPAKSSQTTKVISPRHFATTSAPSNDVKRTDNDQNVVYTILNESAPSRLTTKVPFVPTTVERIGLTQSSTTVGNIGSTQASTTVSPSPSLTTPKPKSDDSVSEVSKQVENYNNTQVPIRNHIRVGKKPRYYNTSSDSQNLQTNVSNSSLTQPYVLAFDFNITETINTHYDIEDNKRSNGKALEQQTITNNQSSPVIILTRNDSDNNHTSISNRKDPVEIEERSSNEHGSFYALGDSFGLLLRWFNPWRRT